MALGEVIDTREALMRAAAALDALSEDRAGLGDEARLGLVGLARQVSRRVGALAVVLVAEADAAKSCETAKGTPLATYLMTDPSVSKAEAMGAVYTGRELAESETVREAALAGDLPVDRAKMVVKAVRQLPESLSESERAAAEADLVAHASELSDKTLARAVRESLGRVAPSHVPSDESEQQRLEAQRKRAYARRSLRLLDDGDGGVDIRGSLPALEAAPLVTMIQSLVAAGRREQRASRDRLDRLAEVTPEQRQADALVLLVARAMGAGSGGAGSWGPGGRARVLVTMRQEDLTARAEQAGLLGDGTEISAGDLRRLCCDAEIVPVVLGSSSEVMDVGRSQRLVTPAMRRALSVRDGGCVFPGCGAPDSRCEAHHVSPWWMGGATVLRNLVLLCPHHHALCEPARFFGVSRSDRWEIEFDDTGLPMVIPPTRVDKKRRPMGRGSIREAAG